MMSRVFLKHRRCESQDLAGFRNPRGLPRWITRNDAEQSRGKLFAGAVGGRGVIKSLPALMAGGVRLIAPHFHFGFAAMRTGNVIGITVGLRFRSPQSRADSHKPFAELKAESCDPISIFFHPFTVIKLSRVEYDLNHKSDAVVRFS